MLQHWYRSPFRTSLKYHERFSETTVIFIRKTGSLTQSYEEDAVANSHPVYELDRHAIVEEHSYNFTTGESAKLIFDCMPQAPGDAGSVDVKYSSFVSSFFHHTHPKIMVRFLP